MAFYDYREPIEYVVDRYFQNKKWIELNSSETKGISFGKAEYVDDTLPDIPCKIVRDEQGRAYKFIYGELDLLNDDNECSPVIWQEELKRNDSGAVEKIITTYPDGTVLENELKRDDTGYVSDFTFSVPNV